MKEPCGTALLLARAHVVVVGGGWFRVGCHHGGGGGAVLPVTPHALPPKHPPTHPPTHPPHHVQPQGSCRPAPCTRLTETHACYSQVNTKPKRVRKSALEKEADKLERDAAERAKALALGGGGADAAQDHGAAKKGATAGVVLGDAEVAEAVIRAQWEHPEYGLKRVVKHLREIRSLAVSESRAKKHLVFPCHAHGAVCVVGEVHAKSPAATAGLQPGDVVVELGGQTGQGCVMRATCRSPSSTVQYSSLYCTVLYM
jgi:hypothetical protein